MREISTMTTINHSLPKVGQITDTNWSKLVLEKDNAVQADVSAKAKRGDEKIKNEMMVFPPFQNK